MAFFAATSYCCQEKQEQGRIYPDIFLLSFFRLPRCEKSDVYKEQMLFRKLDDVRVKFDLLLDGS